MQRMLLVSACYLSANYRIVDHYLHLLHFPYADVAVGYIWRKGYLLQPQRTRRDSIWEERPSVLQNRWQMSANEQYWWWTTLMNDKCRRMDIDDWATCRHHDNKRKENSINVMVIVWRLFLQAASSESEANFRSIKTRIEMDIWIRWILSVG